MAVYGKFSGLGSTIESNILRIIEKNLDEITENSDSIILKGNLVYVANKENKDVYKIINNNDTFDFISKKYLEYGYGDETSGRVFNSIRRTLGEVFIQTYEKIGSNFKSFKFYNNASKIESINSKVKLISNFDNEDYELLNILRYEYEVKYKTNEFTFNDYLCSLYVRTYGIKNNVKSIVIFGNSKSIIGWEVDKFVSQLLAPDETWEKSSKLSAEAIRKSNIFSNKEYQYYSENSNQYKSIFKEIQTTIKESDFFDDFFKTLDINKYFISDVLAIEKNSDVVSTLKNKISKFQQEKNISSLREIFLSMDYYFSQRKFIPVSFKQLQEYSKNELPKKTVSEEVVKNSIVKIINPPKSNYRSEYKGIKLDNFDLLLISIFFQVKKNQAKVESLLTKFVEIDYSTFDYFANITSKTYGGTAWKNYRNLYFEFDVVLGKKRKTYTFELSTNLRIRPKGTSSSTGEGTINSQTLNYVLNEVYKGGFNQKLQKLATSRTKDIISANSEYIKNYKNVMGTKEIITGAVRNDAKVNALKKILLTKETDKDKQFYQQKCISHFLTYYTNLTKKPNPNKITSEDQLITILTQICSKELGLLLDKNVSVNKNIVKIELSEPQKRQLVLSVWGILSARGPIEFNNINFRGANTLEEVMKYQIKFPALVKVGL